jgi:transposase
LRKNGIEPVLAERYAEHGSGLGVFRWVVERSLSWLHQYRRLRVRYERRPDIHEAFLTLGRALICWKQLQHGFC